MRIASRLAVLLGATLSVTLFMSAGAFGSGSLGLAPGGAIRAVSEGRLTLEGAGLTIQCSGSLNGEIALGVLKSGARALPNGLVGALEEARFSECREGFGAVEVRSLLEPSRRAELIYQSFTGTLPNVTGVLLTALEFAIQLRGLVTCLYRGEVGLQVTFPAEEAGNRARILETMRIRLVSGGEICPREGTLRGSLRITPSQRLTLRAERTEETGPLTGRESVERGADTILLTAPFGVPTRIRAFIDAPTEGAADIVEEARCRQWLWWGERCSVRVVGRTRPASGEIIVEYIRGPIVRELRFRYERL